MALCSQCGNKAGVFREICEACESSQHREREEALENQRVQDAEQFKADLSAKIKSWIDNTSRALGRGEKVYVYKQVFVPVDSTVNGDSVDDFDMSFLQVAGLSGWHIESVIPKTVGIGLTNVSYGSSSGETWGAGLGGNVAGAYVLLSKEVRSLDGQEGEDATSVAEELLAAGYEF